MAHPALGRKGKDKITGFAGIVTGFVEHGAEQHGAEQIGGADPTRVTPWNFAEPTVRPGAGSLQLDAGEFDYLRPLLCFIGDEITELGGRTCKRRASEVGKPRFDLGIGEGLVDRPVELIDDFGGCILGHTDPLPTACLEA